MSTLDNHDYFVRRAAQCQKQADAATTPMVRDIYRSMVAAYLARTNDTIPVVRGPSPIRRNEPAEL